MKTEEKKDDIYRCSDNKTIRITGKNLEQREIFTQRKNIGDSGGNAGEKQAVGARQHTEFFLLRESFTQKK